MNEDLYSEETRKFMSEEKKTSIKAEVFSWVKVIVSAIIIALLVDFFIIEAISLFSNTRMMRVLII